MESNLSASYLSLLLGCLVNDCDANKATILKCLGGSFDALINQLKAFTQWQSNNNALTRESLSSIMLVRNAFFFFLFFF